MLRMAYVVSVSPPTSDSPLNSSTHLGYTLCAMRRWAMQAVQLLSVLWATLFLTVSLLHPLTHNPLQHHSGDCLVCTLQQTHSPLPLALHTLLQPPTECWGACKTLAVEDADTDDSRPARQPLIPRAPPA